MLLDDLSSSSNYSQLINEPTNCEHHKNHSCVDLMFTAQPNLVLDGDVLPSLSETCHHKIIFTKINFQIFLLPPYRREMLFMNLGVNQHVYIYQAFDGNPSLETRGVFLDISKAFDKVWHEDLLFKLKCYGLNGELYEILKTIYKIESRE